MQDRHELGPMGCWQCLFELHILCLTLCGWTSMKIQSNSFILLAPWFALHQLVIQKLLVILHLEIVNRTNQDYTKQQLSYDPKVSIHSDYRDSLSRAAVAQNVSHKTQSSSWCWLPGMLYCQGVWNSGFCESLAMIKWQCLT